MTTSHAAGPRQSLADAEVFICVEISPNFAFHRSLVWMAISQIRSKRCESDDLPANRLGKRKFASESYRPRTVILTVSVAKV